MMRSFLHRLASRLIDGEQRHAPKPACNLVPVTPPPTRSNALTTEVLLVLEGVQLVLRESDDDGPRVAVLGLCGAFIYSHEEAVRRIRNAFPELSDAGVKHAVRYLERRVRLKMRPIVKLRRDSWVHGWRGEQPRIDFSEY